MRQIFHRGAIHKVIYKERVEMGKMGSLQMPFCSFQKQMKFLYLLRRLVIMLSCNVVDGCLVESSFFLCYDICGYNCNCRASEGAVPFWVHHHLPQPFGIWQGFDKLS